MRALILLPAILLASSAAAQTGNVGIGTTIPTDQLHTTGTVRFQNYRGSTTRMVQMDSSGRLVVTGDGATLSNNTVSAIPGNGCPGGTAVSRSIAVSGLATSVPSSKIAVRVRIKHPTVAFLRIYLEGPSANIICLANSNGTGANYTNTIFTDEGLVNINSVGASAQPFTGKFKPSGNTTALCGSYQATVATFGAMGGGSINPNATWTLKVFDQYSNPVNSALFEGWDISFSGPESFTTTDQDGYVTRFDGGNLAASNLYQGTGSMTGVRTKTPAATLHVANADGDSILLLENTTPLATGRNVFLDFRNGSTYTARIGTNGVDAQTASLGFYTSAGAIPGNLQKRMSILDGGNVGIGIADASVSERLHVDGSMKLGAAQWSTATNNRLLKFGDGNFVSIGEAGADNRMELTASSLLMKSLSGSVSVGINNPSPAYNLDVTGDFRTTSNAAIGGILSVPNTSILGTVQITSGTPMVGDVLTATNTSGTATWQTPAAPTWTRYVNVMLPSFSPASVGLGIQSGLVTERLHIDTGNIKLGRIAWASAVHDRFIKFGDGDYVSVGETGGDDRMMLTAKQFSFRQGPTYAPRARLLNSELRLYDAGGADSTIVFNGSPASGESGEIYFVDPSTNERTLTIDGDYNASNRSRIIVDELQITGGSDFAEMFDVAPAAEVEPEAGMLVSIDELHPGGLAVSASAYDVKVAGVISGAGGVKPGMMMGQRNTAANGAQPVAITGRVYVKADATREAIRPGDLLTTAALPGHAMKATDRRKRDGAVVGKAMTGLEKGKTGEVLMLLGIQ